MYILLYKEERLIKSEKCASQALKEILVGYNRHTIYKIYIKEQQKVIWVKNLQIFKNYKAKKSTKLSDYSDDMPTFQRFLLENNNKKEPKSYKDQKVNSRREEKQEMPIPCKHQKVDTKKEDYSNSKAYKGQKVKFTTCINAENESKSLYLFASKLPKDAIRK